MSTISPSVVNELRTQVDYRGQSDNRFSGSGAGPSITILGVANFGGPTGAGMVYNETTPEIADTFSYDINTHALKFGFSTRWIRDSQIRPPAPCMHFRLLAAISPRSMGSIPLRIYSSAKHWETHPLNICYTYCTLFNGYLDGRTELEACAEYYDQPTVYAMTSTECQAQQKLAISALAAFRDGREERGAALWFGIRPRQE